MENLKQQLTEIETLIEKAKEIAHNLPSTGDHVTDSIASRIYDRILLVEEYLEDIKYRIIDKGHIFHNTQINFDLEKLMSADSFNVRVTEIDTDDNETLWSLDINDNSYLYSDERFCWNDGGHFIELVKNNEAQ